LSAKSLREVLQREMADFLEGHGYPDTVKGDRKARCRKLEAPLVAVVTPVIEGHRYGGASLTANVQIVAEPVQVFMDGISPEGWARTPRPGEKVQYFLDLTTLGGVLSQGQRGRNLDQQWQVADESGIEPAVAEVGAALLGPVEAWVSERSTVAGVLEQLLRDSLVSPFVGRAGAVLALQHGSPDLARALVSRVVSDRRSTRDELQRLSAFQDSLAEQFPEFQPVELPTVEE
jgi:hypothetical protein